MSMKRFFSRNRRDAEFAREIEAHLEMEIEENEARGLSPEEARRRAYVKFGSARRVRESEWESNTMMLMEGVWRDLKYAARTLPRTPGCTGCSRGSNPFKRQTSSSPLPEWFRAARASG